jgi:hypothetical protein
MTLTRSITRAVDEALHFLRLLRRCCRCFRALGPVAGLGRAHAALLLCDAIRLFSPSLTSFSSLLPPLLSVLGGQRRPSVATLRLVMYGWSLPRSEAEAIGTACLGHLASA